MKRLVVMACFIVFALTGCSRMELTDKGFVLGAALDLDDNGRVALTSQIYKPGSGNPDSQQGGSFVNVQTQGDTLFEAIRDITLELGRKAQWSHMQTLLIGEKLAGSPRFMHSLDFFYRDHEPRLTTPIMITRGRAGDYLTEQPYIEKTISRQIRDMQRIANEATGKTIQADLLDLNKRLRKETSTAILSYIMPGEGKANKPIFAGGALIKKDRMIDVIPPEDVQSYLMLTDQFMSGIIVVPCGSDARKDSVEIITMESRISPEIRGNLIVASVSMTINGAIGELNCTAVTTKEDTFRYENHVAETVERQLKKSIDTFKGKKADILGIGDIIHKKDPKLWERMKEDWDDRFGEIRFEFDIKMNMRSTGLEGGTPVFVE